MKHLIRLVIVSAILMITGCGPKDAGDANGSGQSAKPYLKIATSETLTREDIRGLFPGKAVVFNDEIYAPFNPAYREKWQEDFLNELDRLGMTPKWREDFDCDSFVMKKTSLGQTLFPIHTFHDFKKAQNVAVGEFWYQPEGSKTGHAINVVVEVHEGKAVRRFVDIYTGEYMELSAEEIKSAWFVRF